MIRPNVIKLTVLKPARVSLCLCLPILKGILVIANIHFLPLKKKKRNN